MFKSILISLKRISRFVRGRPYNPYQPLKAIKFYDDKLRQETSWAYPEYNDALAMLKDNPIFKIWQDIDNGIKWHHYFDIYHKIFADTRHKPLKILEIGVLGGSSVKMWRRYFDHADTQIIGIDINPDCQQHEDKGKNIFIRIGSQADPDFLAKLIAEFGPFDIIIDDGSHVASHQITSFNHLFIDGLAHDGIYFIEDTHTAYFTSFRDVAVSIQDFAYQAVDYINYPYYKMKHHEFLYEKNTPKPPINMPIITQLLSEIRFFDSIIVFYKSPQKQPPMDMRINEKN